MWDDFEDRTLVEPAHNYKIDLSSLVHMIESRFVNLNPILQQMFLKLSSTYKKVNSRARRVARKVCSWPRTRATWALIRRSVLWKKSGASRRRGMQRWQQPKLRTFASPELRLFINGYIPFMNRNYERYSLSSESTLGGGFPGLSSSDANSWWFSHSRP